jgi:hypothetical protein
MLSEKARGALRGLDFRQKKTSVEVYLHTNGAKAGLATPINILILKNYFYLIFYVPPFVPPLKIA